MIAFFNGTNYQDKNYDEFFGAALHAVNTGLFQLALMRWSNAKDCTVYVKLKLLYMYNKLNWRIKPKRHESKRNSKSHARHCTFLYTIYKLLLLNRLSMQQLISTHANCLELRQMIKMFILCRSQKSQNSLS